MGLIVHIGDLLTVTRIAHEEVCLARGPKASANIGVSEVLLVAVAKRPPSCGQHAHAEVTVLLGMFGEREV